MKKNSLDYSFWQRKIIFNADTCVTLCFTRIWFFGFIRSSGFKFFWHKSQNSQVFL